MQSASMHKYLNPSRYVNFIRSTENGEEVDVSVVPRLQPVVWRTKGKATSRLLSAKATYNHQTSTVILNKPHIKLSV
jgi:hypothetical protein